MYFLLFLAEFKWFWSEIIGIWRAGTATGIILVPFARKKYAWLLKRSVFNYGTLTRYNGKWSKLTIRDFEPIFLVAAKICLENNLCRDYFAATDLDVAIHRVNRRLTYKRTVSSLLLFIA